jgi:hypothetical protein
LESGGDVICCEAAGAHRGKAGAVDRTAGGSVTLFTDRQLHLVKKVLATATLAVQLRPGLFRSASDQADIRTLLDEVTEAKVELAFYVIAAQLAVTCQPEEMPRSATPRVQH